MSAQGDLFAGYRGFASKAEYEAHYSDPANYANEIPSMEAYARQSDPPTSHLAALQIRHKLPALEHKVFIAVVIGGDRGMNLDEVCEETGLDKVTASPRFRPLERKGYIRRASFTRPGKAGKEQTVWIAVRS